MKWIEDLPDDFTQDFRFTAHHDDPYSFLTANLELGERNWNEVITLTRDEIFKNDITKNGILGKDGILGGKGVGGIIVRTDIGTDPIELTLTGTPLDGGIETAWSVLSGGVIRLVSFYTMAISAIPDLSNLSELLSLDLEDCQRLKDLSGLSGLTKLTALNLGRCTSLTDLSALSGLTELTSLNLGKCTSLTDLSALSGLTELTSLNLSYCPALTDVSALSGLTRLTSLDLSSCEALTEVSGLSGLTGLTSLNLSYCPALTDVSALSGLTGLTSLDLRSCEALTEVSGLSGLTGLTSLNLSGCEALTDVSGLSGLTGLTSLKLSICKALTDVSALSGLTGLTSLHLSGCEALTDVSGLSGLTGLTSLDLSMCDASIDLSGLSGLTGLTVLDLSNSDLTMADLSEISELRNLEQLDLRYCTGLSAKTLWKQVSGLSRLRSVEGMGAALDQLIPFNSAILRKSKEAISRGRGDILEHAKTGAGVGLLAKRLALKSLAVCPLDESSLQEFKSVSWSDSEWEILWRAIHENGAPFYADFLVGELDEAKTVASLSDMMTDPTGSDTSMASNLLGWLRTVADGMEWQKAKSHVTEMTEWLPFAEMKSGAVELLMAMRQLGLVNEERTVLSMVTDKRAREFTEMVEYRLATNHAKSGRWKDAMRHIQRLPQDLADEVRSDVIARWSTEVPDQVAEWMSGFHSEVTREKTALELASMDSSIASSSARHLVLMDLVPNRDALESFIQQMASALPDDPWVVALQDEILSAGAPEAGASQEVMETLGLEMLWHDEAVRTEVGERTLRKFMEARGEEVERVREQARQAAMDLLRREDLID